MAFFGAPVGRLPNEAVKKHINNTSFYHTNPAIEANTVVVWVFRSGIAVIPGNAIRMPCPRAHHALGIARICDVLLAFGAAFAAGTLPLLRVLHQVFHRFCRQIHA